MKNIVDFLKYDNVRYGRQLHEGEEIKYEYEIVQIEENPFYIPFGDKTKHWELRITPSYRNLKEPHEEDREWAVMDRQTVRFKMTAYMKPTIEIFSEHIYNELRAIFFALVPTRGKNKSDNIEEMYVWDFQQITLCPDRMFDPKEIYAFIKNIHKDYSNTEDFLNVYEHFNNRMYHGLKFADYLLEGNEAMYSMDFNYPIGEHLTAFLDLGKVYDHYEEVVS